MDFFMGSTQKETHYISMVYEFSLARHHEETADRFRTFDLDISDFFERIAAEERDHAEMLVNFFQSRYGGQYNRDELSKSGDVFTEYSEDDDHFLIFSTSMADRVLEHAVGIEEKAVEFYRKTLQEIHDDLLFIFYEARLHQHRCTVREIREKLSEENRRNSVSISFTMGGNN